MKAYEGSTSLRVSRARRLIAESIAIEISNRFGIIVRPSAILNFVLDRYLNTEVINDFIEKYEIEQEKEKAKKLAFLAANPPKKRGRPKKEDRKS